MTHGDSIGLSHLSYMGQWDRTDTYRIECVGGTHGIP